MSEPPGTAGEDGPGIRGPDVARNPSFDPSSPATDDELALAGPAAHDAARDEIASWPGYAPTPLHGLSGLADRLELGALAVKDEGGRFGLGSFKALGGAYGVLRVVAEEVARRTGGEVPAPRRLRDGTHAEVVSRIAVTCATDGNHGRAVAWGAELIGARCVVYVPGHVTPHRIEAIEGHGARVVRVEGEYDEAVARADADARARGRLVVSDHAYPGYREVPRTVMQGYTVMVEEAIDGWSGPPPSHVFVQAGVGGLAAAVAARLRVRIPGPAPRLVLVEPEEADALFRSLRAGERRPAGGTLETLMGGLSCREVSTVAWPVLRRRAAAALRIPDRGAAVAMRTLADPRDGDRPVVAGESGAAGVGGLLLAAGCRESRNALGLDASSRVLAFVTEGATDPGRYRRIVGRDAGEVGG